MRGSESRPAFSEQGINIANSFVHQNIIRTPITEALTSNYNVRYLMNSLQAAVLANTGILIGPQPIQVIAAEIKYHYLLGGPYKVHLPDIEVERINRVVLQKLVNDATQGLEANGRYLRDSLIQPVPPDRPMNVNTKGDRQFEINRFL